MKWQQTRGQIGLVLLVETLLDFLPSPGVMHGPIISELQLKKLFSEFMSELSIKW